MTALAADLLVLWVTATAVCSGLLAAVVVGQGAVDRARRAAHRRTRSAVRPRVSAAAAPPAPR